MSASAAIPLQAAISADNIFAAIAIAKIKAEEERQIQAINAVLDGIHIVGKILKKIGEHTADCI